MQKLFDPNSFNPNVLADSLESEIQRQFEQSLLPVNLVTKIIYEPERSAELVITDRHIPQEHPFVWGFTDFAPFYMRLHVYLRHWVEKIKADIHEVRIQSDQFDEVVVAKAGIEDWMHNGGPLLMH